MKIRKFDALFSLVVGEAGKDVQTLLTILELFFSETFLLLLSGLESRGETLYSNRGCYSSYVILA